MTALDEAVARLRAHAKRAHTDAILIANDELTTVLDALEAAQKRVIGWKSRTDWQLGRAVAAESKLARIKRLSDNEWSYGPDEFGVFKAALRAILNDKVAD